MLRDCPSPPVVRGAARPDVALAPGAVSVRVWQIASRGSGLRTGDRRNIEAIIIGLIEAAAKQWR